MKYPNGIVKKTTTNHTTHAHRGMNFEDDINLTNTYYKEQGVALIHKKPTPIKATDIKYQNNSKKICDGYFEKASTTDYNGVYKGYHIDFEAKVTTSLTSFPIGNIHDHQLDHLRAIATHGGISFILIDFCKLNKTFLLETDKIFDIIKDRKSIPLAYLEEHGFIVENKYQPRIDYIRVVDEIIRRKHENKI